MKAIVPVVLVALLAGSLDAEAQFQRRDRTQSPREPAKERERDNPKAAAVDLRDPYSALERELPSLKADLKLTGDQVNAWSVFERDVRDVAEMARARLKHITALREAGDVPPTAVKIVAALVEDDRLKAEATGDLLRHLDALYAKLDDAQKRTLDKRVALSQTEPLGR
jgi:hypothetical protein